MSEQQRELWHVMRSVDGRRAYVISVDRVVTDSAGCTVADAELIVAAVNGLPGLFALADELDRELDGYGYAIRNGLKPSPGARLRAALPVS